MLQGEHSAILPTFIKLPFAIKTFALSIFEWSFYTGFTVCAHTYAHIQYLCSFFLLNVLFTVFLGNEEEIRGLFKYECK